MEFEYFFKGFLMIMSLYEISRTGKQKKRKL